VFLDVLTRRNPAFVEAVVGLHQAGVLPANCYALDLDTIRANARVLRSAGERHGVEVFAMAKQFGRNPDVIRALREEGIDRTVAVDMECARAGHRHGMRIGHVGHLVQVPRAEAAAAATMEPDNWTVFSDDKAAEAAAASQAAGREQPLLARIHAEGDTFYPGHEGGFAAGDVVAVAERLDALDGARFAGVTSFPALLFDQASGEVRPTRNLSTLQQAAQRVRAAGAPDVRVNAPGTTSSELFSLLADHGATQVEPGHGITGTTPLHAIRDLAELPAVLYVTEVSHHHGDRAYAFGGGMYVDPVFGPYQVRALAGREPSIAALRRHDAFLPPPSAIDYYGQLDPVDGRLPQTGETVVFGFRVQAFVTRAFTAAIAGAASGSPRVEGVWAADGGDAAWPL
jgi:predicted amino acid racemase